MRNFLTVILPAPLEALYYGFLSLLMLVAFSASDLWHHLLQTANTDPRTSETISESIKLVVNQSTHLSDPQIVNAVIWGATAGISLLIVGGIGHAIKITKEESIERRTHSGAISFWTRMCLRIGSAIALVVFAVVFISLVLPAVLSVFESNLLTLATHWLNILWVIGTIIAVAACLYIFAVLCRLFVLRLRVFSEIYE